MAKDIGKIPGLLKSIQEFAVFCKIKWRAIAATIITITIVGSIFLLLFYGYKKIELLGNEVGIVSEGVDTTVGILEETHTSVSDLQESFTASINENLLIERKMTRCLFAHDADSMVVLKFHNSRTDLQGKHDFFYSATNEVTADGVRSFSPEVQMVPVVRLGALITPMLENKCQAVRIEGLADNSWMKNKLSSEGIAMILSCPIYSTKGSLLGFSELIYKDGTPLPEGKGLEEIKECFKHTTNEISLIIQK